MIIKGQNYNELYYKTVNAIADDGNKSATRNGDAYELFNTQLVLTQNYQRHTLIPYRNNNPIATIVETLWVIMGDDNIDFLSKFLPRAKEYSDDGCFSGDTKVSLLDGTEITFKELENNYRDKEFWVYSCKEDGTIVPAKAHSPRITKFVDELVVITLDNGELITCTKEHRIMMRDGSYKEAVLLNKNESLMPLYRKLDEEGYELYKDNLDEEWEYTHKMVSELIYKSKRHKVRHHKNFNKRDNRPENLKWMSWIAHRNYHNKIAKTGAKTLIKYNKSDAGRKKSRDLWENKEFKKMMLEIIREIGISFWKNNDYRKMMIESVSNRNLENWKNNEYRKFMENVLKNNRENRWSSDEQKIKQSKLMKELNVRFKNDEIIQQKIKEVNKNPEILKIRSNTMKRLNSCKDFQSKALLSRVNKFKDKKNICDNIEQNNSYNHKIVKLEVIKLEEKVPVYDLTVENYHNFALSAGVIVHNSTWNNAYGKRIRNWHGKDQLMMAYKELKDNKETRRCVIGINDPTYCLNENTKDVACNLFLNFYITDNSLNLTVASRSMDFLWGSMVNFYEWSIIQSMLAYWLDLKVGTYTHNVTNLHIYGLFMNKALETISQDEYNMYDYIVPVSMPEISQSSFWNAEVNYGLFKVNDYDVNYLDFHTLYRQDVSTEWFAIAFKCILLNHYIENHEYECVKKVLATIGYCDAKVAIMEYLERKEILVASDIDVLNNFRRYRK